MSRKHKNAQKQRAAGAAPGVLSSHSVQSVLRQVGVLIAFGVALFFFQRFLLRLSGSALWLPVEWREAVHILGLLLGTIAFGFVRVRMHGLAHDAGTHGPNVSAEESARRKRRAVRFLHAKSHRSAVWSFVIAALALSGYIVLRGYCVVKWDLRDWKEMEAVTLKASEPGHGAADGVWQRDDGSEIPSFIDVGRNEVYIPFLWPAKMSELLKNREREKGCADGLADYLQSDPVQLFDQISVICRTLHALTTAIFLGLHFVIVWFASAAVGYTYSAVDSIIEMAAHH